MAKEDEMKSQISKLLRVVTVVVCRHLDFQDSKKKRFDFRLIKKKIAKAVSPEQI